MMTKKEYLAARRLIRDNGDYARHWLSHDQNIAMRRLITIQKSRDPLADRAQIRYWNSGREDFYTKMMLTTWITREQMCLRQHGLNGACIHCAL